MNMQPQAVAIPRATVRGSFCPYLIAKKPTQPQQMSSIAKIVYAKARATVTLLGIENG